jgi:hypothetical protein
MSETTVPERWKYTGPDSSLVQPRNLRGINGRVEVSGNSKGRRTIKMDGFSLDLPQGLAWELSSALSTALRPFAGFSIFEQIMTSLDAAVDELMAEIESYDEDDEERELAPEILQLKGEIGGYITVMCIMRGSDDTEGEKKRAMDRYNSRQGK